MVTLGLLLVGSGTLLPCWLFLTQVKFFKKLKVRSLLTLHRRRVCIVLVLDICVALVLNICVAQAMAIEMCRISSNVPQEAEYCDTSLWLYLPIDSHHASIPAQGFATPMTLTKQLRVPVALVPFLLSCSLFPPPPLSAIGFKARSSRD